MREREREREREKKKKKTDERERRKNLRFFVENDATYPKFLRIPLPGLHFLAGHSFSPGRFLALEVTNRKVHFAIRLEREKKV